MKTDNSYVQNVEIEGFIDKNNESKGFSIKTKNEKNIIGRIIVPTDNSWCELLNEHFGTSEKFHSRVINKRFLIISKPYEEDIFEIGHKVFTKTFVVAVSMRTGLTYRILYNKNNLLGNIRLRHFDISKYKKSIVGEEYFISCISSVTRCDGYCMNRNCSIYGKTGKVLSDPFLVNEEGEKELFIKVDIDGIKYNVLFYEQDLIENNND